MIGLLSGSLRPDSYNTQLLDELKPYIGDDYIQLQIADIGPYREDIPTPVNVHNLRDQIKSLDALIISTPEYNGSVPGHLKNALDWLSRPHPDNALRKKPVIIYGVSTGMFGAVWAQADLRKILGIIGAQVLDEGEIPIGLMSPGQKILADESIKNAVLKRLNLLKSTRALSFS